MSLQQSSFALRVLHSKVRQQSASKADTGDTGATPRRHRGDTGATLGRHGGDTGATRGRHGATRSLVIHLRFPCGTDQEVNAMTRLAGSTRSLHIQMWY